MVELIKQPLSYAFCNPEAALMLVHKSACYFNAVYKSWRFRVIHSLVLGFGIFKMSFKERHAARILISTFTNPDPAKL